MTKYIVQGGHPLFGEVRISGAKNAAVAIIPAALLVDGVCRIENIPQISHAPPVQTHRRLEGIGSILICLEDILTSLLGLYKKILIKQIKE